MLTSTAELLVCHCAALANVTREQILTGVEWQMQGGVPCWSFQTQSQACNTDTGTAEHTC